MKKIFPAFIVLIFITSVSAEWIWVKKSSLPYGRRDRAVGFSLGKFGFIGTGMDSTNMVLNDFWRYDTLTDSWSQVATLPGVPRRDAVSFVIDSFAYVGTGIDDSSSFGNTLTDFYRYNSNTNQWDSIASVSGMTGGMGVYKAAATSLNGKGYVIGGRYWGYNVGENWCYDPATNSWTQLNGLPVADGRSGGVAFAGNGKIFYCTGSDDNYYYNQLWEFSPSTGQWIQKPSFPGTERISPVCFSIDSTAFVGTGTDGGYKRDFWSYNPHTDSWNYVNMFDGDGRRSATAFSIGMYGFISCGKAATGTKKDLWRMQWHEPVPENTIEPLEKNKFVVYPNIISIGEEIHISGLSKSPDEILEVYKSDGRKIQTIVSVKENELIQFSTSGEYFIRLRNADNYSTTQKIIVW